MSVLRGFQTIEPSFEALFERFLRNFTGIGVPKGERLEGLNVDVILSPDGAARGGVAPLGVPVFSPCPLCGGSGRDWLFPCTYCQEQGMVEEEETVRIRIPPMVRDGTILEVPIRGLGIHNFYSVRSIRGLAPAPWFSRYPFASARPLRAVAGERYGKKRGGLSNSGQREHQKIGGGLTIRA
jgi:hypothetical protein